MHYALQPMAFPWDVMECNWRFSSWVNPTEKVKYHFTADPIKLEVMTKDLEWRLLREHHYILEEFEFGE